MSWRRLADKRAFIRLEGDAGLGLVSSAIVPSYNVYFHHSIDTGDQHLSVGDAFRWDSVIRRVEEGEGDRVVLKLWPNGLDYPPEIKGTSA